VRSLIQFTVSLCLASKRASAQMITEGETKSEKPRTTAKYSSTLDRTCSRMLLGGRVSTAGLNIDELLRLR